MIEKPDHPIRELVGYFLRLGTLGFGGPVALVGQMERELVTERGWLTKDEYLDGLATVGSVNATVNYTHQVAAECAAPS